jgi:hypothetical protein
MAIGLRLGVARQAENQRAMRNTRQHSQIEPAIQMRAKMAAPPEGRSGRASWRPSSMATSGAQLIALQLRGIVLRKVGAQQVSALPPARLSSVTIELITKRRTTPI